jgi:hypothetical protein
MMHSRQLASQGAFSNIDCISPLDHGLDAKILWVKYTSALSNPNVSVGSCFTHSSHQRFSFGMTYKPSIVPADWDKELQYGHLIAISHNAAALSGIISPRSIPTIVSLLQ